MAGRYGGKHGPKRLAEGSSWVAVKLKWQIDRSGGKSVYIAAGKTAV